VSSVQAVALGIRLFTIWLAIYWARSIPYLFAEARDAEGWAPTVVALAYSGLLVGFVVVLWFFPRTVARTLLPEERAAPQVNTSPDTWFAVGCALIGLWVLASVLPGVFREDYLFLYAKRNSIALPEQWESSVIYYVVQLAVGVWLLLGAKGVRKLVWWARNARYD
jgi:hypothetical protein